MKLISMHWTVQSLVLVTPLLPHSTRSSEKPTTLQVVADFQILRQLSMTTEMELREKEAADEQVDSTCPMMTTTKVFLISGADL